MNNRRVFGNWQCATEGQQNRKLIDSLIEYFLIESQEDVLNKFWEYVKSELTKKWLSKQEWFWLRNIKKITPEWWQDVEVDCWQLVLLEWWYKLLRISPEIFDPVTEQSIIDPIRFEINLVDRVQCNLPDIEL